MRTTTDVLRRGLDSMLANWPLIAIRIVESLLFLIIIVGSVVAAVVPVVVAAGFSRSEIENSENPAEAVVNLIVEHWMLIFYVLAIVIILFGVLIALHSFVEAGNARVFIDAERNAGGATTAPRESLRAFTIDRWLAGGRGSWWPIFWIYNLAWSVAGLIILVPLLLTLVFMLMVSDAGPRIAIGCGGVALAVLMMIPIAIVTAIWTQKAIAVCVSRMSDARAALAEGWAQVRSDLGRHLAVAFLLFAISFGGAMALSMFTTPLSMLRNVSHTPAPFDIAFAPAQIVSSVLQSVFSAAVGLWFLASYVGLTEERR